MNKWTHLTQETEAYEGETPGNSLRLFWVCFSLPLFPHAASVCAPCLMDLPSKPTDRELLLSSAVYDGWTEVQRFRPRPGKAAETRFWIHVPSKPLLFPFHQKFSLDAYDVTHIGQEAWFRESNQRGPPALALGQQGLGLTSTSTTFLLRELA